MNIKRGSSPPPLPPPPEHLINEFANSSNSFPTFVSQKPPLRISSRLSMVSSSESSSGELSLSSSSSSSSSSSASSRPEPPQRTVSIRNSASSIYDDHLVIDPNAESCYSRPDSFISLPHQQQQQRRADDSNSVRSIYSSYRGALTANNTFHSSIVRSSKSVFSIYEEEDESSSSVGSTAGVSSISSSASSNNVSYPKLDRLTEFEIKKIESMYRSIGCVVQVSACTCDLYTTNSEQIANLLNDCWKLEVNSIVPVWLFDTGYNPKRPKQLRLLFVDRHTAFPIPHANLINKPIQINYQNLLKNPNNDKRLTFTLKNKQLVCLIQFNDFFSCQEYYKFYKNLNNNPRYSDLFKPNESNENKMNQSNDALKKSQSRSMLSLSKISGNKNTNRKNRYSEVIGDEVDFVNSKQNLKANSTHLNEEVKVTGITKHCISNPCAFQHINSLKDNDQRVRLILDNFTKFATNTANVLLNKKNSKKDKF